MTTIELVRDKRSFYTLVDGHAGYDDAGRDIVCAGVSALTYALAAGLNDCGALLKYESGDGREEMYGAGGAARVLFRTFELAVQELARQYPEHVRVNGTVQ